MKKVSKVNQVRTMLSTNPNLTTVEIMEKFAVKKPYAQTLLWNAKGGAKKLRATKLAKAKAGTVRQYSETEVEKLIATYRFNINALNTKLSELDTQNTALKIDMLDQQAVINYLEKKLIK